MPRLGRKKWIIFVSFDKVPPFINLTLFPLSCLSLSPSTAPLRCGQRRRQGEVRVIRWGRHLYLHHRWKHGRYPRHEAPGPRSSGLLHSSSPGCGQTHQSARGAQVRVCGQGPGHQRQWAKVSGRAVLGGGARDVALRYVSLSFVLDFLDSPMKEGIVCWKIHKGTMMMYKGWAPKVHLELRTTQGHFVTLHVWNFNCSATLKLRLKKWKKNWKFRKEPHCILN